MSTEERDCTDLFDEVMSCVVRRDVDLHGFRTWGCCRFEARFELGLGHEPDERTWCLRGRRF